VADISSERLVALLAHRSLAAVSTGSDGSRGLRVRQPGEFRATSDYSALAEADAAIICVPTPLGKTKDPDLAYVIAATEETARHLHRGMLIVLESTTYPGTTEELILPRLEEAHSRQSAGW